MTQKTISTSNPFASLKLSRKLTYAFLLAALVPMLFIIVLALYQSSSAMQKQIYEQLSAISSIKKSAIERYFSAADVKLKSVAISPFTQDAAIAFKEAYYGVEPEAQSATLSEYYDSVFYPEYKKHNPKQSRPNVDLTKIDGQGKALQMRYIVNNPHPIGEKQNLHQSTSGDRYDIAHTQYHNYFNQLASLFEFHDIFLVDNDTGTVIYSVFKELDFATSLKDGPYADSNIAKAFRLAQLVKGPNELVFVDYQTYLPSYHAPASFIAAPVVVNGRHEATLIYQLSIDTLNQIMSERDGLGESGETYLVGSDGLMRSDSYLDPVNHSVINSFRNPDKGRVDTEAVKRAQSGETGQKIITDYNGNPVLSSYQPIQIFDKQWSLLAEIDEKEAFHETNVLRLFFITSLIITGLVLSFVAIKFARALASPIQALANTIQRVEQEGDFSLRAPVQSADEIGQTAQVFNSMLEALQASISETNQVMDKLSHGDFSQRINVNCRGELDALKQATNYCADSLDTAMAEVNQVMNAMAQGQFDKTITRQLDGDLNVLKENTNATLASLNTTIGEIVSVMTGLESGQFDGEVTADAKGMLGQLKLSVNNSVTSLNSAVTEINQVMSAINQGDFSQRVELPLQGDMEHMKQNINDSMDSLALVLGDINDVMESVSDGKFNVQIESPAEGQLAQIKRSVNHSVENLNTAFNGISNVMRAISQGDFSKRLDLPLKGQLDSLKNDINQSVENLSVILNEITAVMSSVCQGDFSVKVESDANGQLLTLKHDVNTTITTLSEAVSDISCVMMAISQGNFNKKIESSMKGQLDALKTDINHSVNTLSGVVTALAEVMTAMRAGDFNQTITIPLNGQLSTLKEDVNATIQGTSQAINQVTQVLGSIANGNLSSHMEGEYKGVFDILKTDLNRTVDKLTEVIQGIQDAADQVKLNASEIAQSSQLISQKTEEQAAALEQASSSTSSMLEEITEISDQSDNAVALSSDAGDIADEGFSLSNDTVQAIDEVNASSKAINEIVSVIDNLAFQTNLLALNAAVEAARAGEHGRGFAVVATEVRELASKSASSAKQIKEIIGDSHQKVEHGTRLANLSGEKLSQIISSVSTVNASIVKINQSTSQQTLSIKEVNTVVQRLATIVQNNSAVTEETMAAAKHLADRSSEMRSLLSYFNIQAQGPDSEFLQQDVP